MAAKISNLEQLLSHAQLRLRCFVDSPVFAKIASREALDNPRARRVVLACARRFSINFQTMLFTRQALCTDPKFYPTFLRHFEEEFRHDMLLGGEEVPEPIQDTWFEAAVAWFNYQMIVLDNAERAALMHLVLEAGGDQFHVLVAPYLRDQVRSGYFDVHAELDAGHAQLGGELLEGLGAATYQRLADVVDRGWDMIDVTFERVHQLVVAAT